MRRIVSRRAVESPRRRASLPAWLLPLLLAACVPGPPPPASQYREAAAVTRLPLVFAPGGTQPIDSENAELRDLSRSLPVQAAPVLRASGPLAFARAQAVGRLLLRPVELVAAPGMPPDQALLVISGPAIVADACRGPGVRQLGSNWPSNDDDAPVLLPPGCAVAVNIEAQTTRPADLLQGRPLPPGAAMPFAAAIEKYYHRNDPGQSNASAPQGGSQSPAGSGSSAEADGSAPGLLTGPLPAAGQGGQTQTGQTQAGQQ
jgi:hypothetical protein